MERIVMAVLDTSAVISILRGSAKGKALVEKHADEIGAVSAITVHEVLLGAREEEMPHVMGFLRGLELLPFDFAVAERSAQLERELLKKGKQIGKFDTLIAATCLMHGIPILTIDSDFERVPGLHVIRV